MAKEYKISEQTMRRLVKDDMKKKSLKIHKTIFKSSPKN